MRINLNPPADATAKNESTTFLMIRFAITYSVFLLIILLLMVHLHRVSTTRSEEDFWNQDQSTFESAVSLLDNNFTTMDSITRQLSMNTKLYHLATMKSTDDNDFYLSGLTMKQSLASYMYSYNELPFSTYFVYLRNSGYIISVNTFNSEQLYYIRNYLSSGANFNEWHDLLNNNLTKDSALYPLSDFMLPESGNAYLYVLNMDVLTYKDIPATVAFHINEQTLRKIFSGVSLGDTGYIIAVDAQDQPVFSLSEDKNTSSEKDLNTLTESVLSLSYDDNNTCVHNDTHIMRIASKTNDWTFYLVQPESIYPSDYQFIFLLILFAAIIGGLIMIFILVRNNMRPILHLDDQLQETLHANTQLIEEADAIRPVLYDNYLRQLMSGVITTPDELSFIQNYLHLEDPSLHYYVLYGVTYENDPAADTFPNENTSTESSESMKDIIAGLLARYFSYENNLYLCSPKKHIYAVLIPFSGTADEILITLQEKALKFHSELLEEYSIWFFAGIGLSCSFTNIWESYQQAKDAAGYTSKNYIFLPYEMLKKDSHVYYYPAEFSTRLIRSITGGNKSQVIEIFNLIHQENIEERSLPFQLLRFLLTDIRNTLLKARFTYTGESTPQIVEIDTMLSQDELTFRLCEDISIKLCDFFASKSEKNNLIDSIVTYIRENYKNPALCLSKISDEFHISESYFSHMFKENMNVNFSVYLEDLRLTEAAHLIEKGESGINEIALEVGYNNQTSFRRAFKKKYGVTPSSFGVQS